MPRHYAWVNRALSKRATRLYQGRGSRGRLFKRVSACRQPGMRTGLDGTRYRPFKAVIFKANSATREAAAGLPGSCIAASFSPSIMATETSRSSSSRKVCKLGELLGSRFMRKAAKAKRKSPGARRSAPSARAPRARLKAATLEKQNKQDYGRYPELRLIYDTAPVGLAFLTPDCRYMQINQRLTEICGMSVEDHIGRTVRETVPQVAEQVEKLVEAIIRTGEPITGIEVNGQRVDQSNAHHTWITSWHPSKNAEGQVVGINVVAEDITERKRAEAVLAASEKALHESEVRFREVADSISQMAWTADRAGRRNWYNKRWLDFTGTTLEEMKGFGWQKCHHPEH